MDHTNGHGLGWARNIGSDGVDVCLVWQLCQGNILANIDDYLTGVVSCECYNLFCP